ncbi:phosphoenolpyruvate-protein phosphotransferase [Treponema primitia ZAS-2]|uniref:Phosphoenolpyruvate-protein phosphotransferase n=1 Tax=Treponema primitia (strain ATCC BAA-887 / DSM 12427 / ZAS-2) TaxID=545694 RepID=F5YNM0_TREPZ|nr:phosphoenolpyruvate--protein phosphotransferase [Treponema primitia]AEF86809.1 phosphoenolpyruvate-protein phosphotransferase [Treponema primitia ZAS-2]
MITLQGKGVSDGIALGKLTFLERTHFSVEKRTITDVPAEVERFNAARETAAAQLEELSRTMAEKIGKENALLFDIHSMMLSDPDFFEPMIGIIENQKICAEYAVMEAGSALAQDFADMDDDYMKERAADVRDVANRVVAILSGTWMDVSAGSDPVILAADDFSPSETVQFDRSKVLALVSRAGAANSHTAIFARTMGIPAIIGFGSSLSAGLAGVNAAVDGGTGVLCIDPGPAVIEEFQKKHELLEEEKQAMEKYRGRETLTKSGKKIQLFANIGSVTDVEAAILGDAEGIGLFRSEFLYLGREDYPGEEEQYETYKRVLELMKGKQVIIRTMDIGADKQAAYFGLPGEENPALGMRAIRICLTRPELFKTQLRAIYRASSFGNAAIMFPMICSVAELLRAKAILKEVRNELQVQGIAFNEKVPVGIMIETPAAAIISDLLAKEADFFSIGTNDLTQYTLAIDRQNDLLSEFCDIHHEAILRLIKLSCDNAHNAGIPIGICGSLGADKTLTQFFIETGIDELSVEPSCVLPLRKVIAKL